MLTVHAGAYNPWGPTLIPRFDVVDVMLRARRVATGAVAVTAGLVLATAPAAAADSISEELIRGLNRRLLYIAVPIAVLVEFILVYTIWRFRGNDDPLPTRTNRDLEITWTFATALVLLFVGSASYAVLTSPFVAAVPELDQQLGEDAAPQPDDAPPDAVVVEVVTEQWQYTFQYPNDDVTTQEALVLPRDRPVYIYVTSRDVLHSVHVPELGLKQDAFPGEYQLIHTRLDETGEYRLYCAEYCGDQHARMRSTLRVVDEGQYQNWLDDQRTDESDGGQENATATAIPQHKTATGQRVAGRP